MVGGGQSNVRYSSCKKNNEAHLCVQEKRDAIQVSVDWFHMLVNMSSFQAAAHLHLHRFERLVSLAIHLLGDHRGRPNEQFKALSPHVLDENCKVQLPAPAHLDPMNVLLWRFRRTSISIIK